MNKPLRRAMINVPVDEANIGKVIFDLIDMGHQFGVNRIVEGDGRSSEVRRMKAQDRLALDGPVKPRQLPSPTKSASAARFPGIKIQILKLLAKKGPRTIAEIMEHLEITNKSTIPNQMQALRTSGFVRKGFQKQWLITTAGQKELESPTVATLGKNGSGTASSGARSADRAERDANAATLREKIVELLKGGIYMPADLIEKTGASKNAVQWAIKRMRDMGTIVSTDEGWALAGGYNTNPTDQSAPESEGAAA